MGKTGRKNRGYSAEFKIGVIMDMREHRLGYRETMRKYNLGKSGGAVATIQRWGRIFLEEGAEGLMKERRGRACAADLQQVRDMLSGLFAKLPETARPVFHSDQGWQYQHAEYQRLLAEHNITQSMSRKGNYMDNGTMENFFGRLKVEMFYGEHFESVEDFIHVLHDYIHYYNNDRISLKLKGMSPVQYRTHSQETQY